MSLWVLFEKDDSPGQDHIWTTLLFGLGRLWRAFSRQVDCVSYDMCAIFLWSALHALTLHIYIRRMHSERIFELREKFHSQLGIILLSRHDDSHQRLDNEPC